MRLSSTLTWLALSLTIVLAVVSAQDNNNIYNNNNTCYVSNTVTNCQTATSNITNNICPSVSDCWTLMVGPLRRTLTNAVYIKVQPGVYSEETIISNFKSVMPSLEISAVDPSDRPVLNINVQSFINIDLAQYTNPINVSLLGLIIVDNVGSTEKDMIRVQADPQATIGTSNFTFINSTITNCNRTSSGYYYYSPYSCLNVKNFNVVMRRSSVTNSTALSNPVVSLRSEKAVVDHSSFTDNTGTSLRFDGNNFGSLHLSNSKFVNNIGAAFKLDEMGSLAKVEVDNCVFHSNSPNMGPGYGGAVYIGSSSFNVNYIFKNNVFSNNTASSGSAVYSTTSGSVSFQSCNFTNNHGDMGTIYISTYSYSGASLGLVGSQFMNNHGTYNQGIDLYYNNPIDIEGGIFHTPREPMFAAFPTNSLATVSMYVESFMSCKTTDQSVYVGEDSGWACLQLSYNGDSSSYNNDDGYTLYIWQAIVSSIILGLTFLVSIGCIVRELLK
ncbi:hypothetical protein SAMD00019534_077430, partial [Acytostelium subglobosum LB1]|uniref:hypothetical protein n=1 Tax=Acytostelium subglobosum LB1 TaxID=1410327 RepID=UPI0006450145